MRRNPFIQTKQPRQNKKPNQIKPKSQPKKKQTTKRGQDLAELNALLEKQKPFSLQRLMRDYNEIKNQPIPIPGVSAIPLDNNFYEWHGNIKAPYSSAHKGGVLHFRLVFTSKYPIEPPEIFLLNNIIHPNVLTGGRICLDILEKKAVKNRGWTPAYTVLSILIQLQSFFFEVTNTSLYTDRIAREVIEMNEFRCTQCQHRGSTNPYPPFIANENDKDAFKMTKEAYDISKKEELCCYLRRVPFNETPLGLGISISKIPRTGEIKQVIPRFNFISLKAYTKERIRVDVDGNSFTHWFPLYFGVNEDKFLISCTKAISMIAKDNTKSFSPELILKVFPKFFNYVALNIISEKVHNSSLAISILIYLYRILLLLIKHYPSVKDELNANIEKFVKDESSRVKEHTPSLGDLLVMLACSDKHKIEDVLPAYIAEQMDRQIFWIIQEIPKFEELVNSTEIDEIRAKICFKTGIVGEQLLLFYYYFIKKIVFKSHNTLDEFAAYLDQHNANLPEQEIDIHRKNINDILKIDNYNAFYKYLNITPPEPKALNEKLKQSFTNSLKKGYHGDDLVRFVPDETQQAIEYMKRYPSINEIMKDNKLLDANDPKWIELVNRIDIVKQFKLTYPNEEITPLAIIRHERKMLGDTLFYNHNLQSKKTGNETNYIKRHFNKHYFIKEIEDESIIKTLSMRQLYLKLFMEDYFKFFPYTKEFKELYLLLDLCKDDLIHLRLSISTTGILKSNWNYIRAILSKLVNLKYLCFLFKNEINVKLLKNIVKGITNSSGSGCQITHLKIMANPIYHKFTSKDLNLLTCIDKLSFLKVLDLSNVHLDINSALRIRNHLYYYKTIEVLDLSNTNLDESMGKEIADGIMKAKLLEKIYLNSNQTQKALSSIIYNLSFQPKIKVIDISENTSCDKKETAIALYKLLKMSQTIEIIIAKGIPQLNGELTRDFFISLGDSTSLIYLDLSNSSPIRMIDLLGQAIAFNALKKGVLKKLVLRGMGISYMTLTSMIKGMEINEFDHFTSYGFQFNSNIKKDTQEYYAKQFFCNLELLDISNSIMKCSENINDIKQTHIVNHLSTLFSKNKHLEVFVLNNCECNAYFISMLANALMKDNNIKYIDLSNNKIEGSSFDNFIKAFHLKDQPDVVNPHFHIEALDISKNKLGYYGIERLCKELLINKTIKYLNVFHNLFEVNGARRVQEMLAKTTTLEEFDIGYNRIKSSGFKLIMQGINDNIKQTKLKFLGMKYNFVKDECFVENMKQILDNEDMPLERIELKNNSITDRCLMKSYKEFFVNGKKKIKTDVFDVLFYLEPERLERTVWISAGKDATPITIINEIIKAEKECIQNDNSHLGIPLFIRKKRGRKVGKKKNNFATDCFIEFIMPNSVNRMLKIASTTGFYQNGKKTKVCKAGTKPNYIIVKKKELD